MHRRSRTHGESAPEGRHILAQGVSPGYTAPNLFLSNALSEPRRGDTRCNAIVLKRQTRLSEGIERIRKAKRLKDD